VTEVLTLDPHHPDPQGIERAAAVLTRGGLVAFPTETVYGLGAHALDPDAVGRVFTAKGRPAEDPLIVHVHDATAIARLTTGRLHGADALAARFWPGPLTMILRRSPAVPLEVTAGLETVAIRIPAHPIAHALLSAAALPVAAPSANLFSRPSPTRAAHVLEDLDGRIDLVIDGGPAMVGVESTVIDLTAPVPTILRPGAVTLEMIRAVLPDVTMMEAAVRQAGAGMTSPGLLSRHYSPRAEMMLYEGPTGRVLERMSTDASSLSAGGRRVGILAADEDSFGTGNERFRIERLGSELHHTALATHLYDAIRRLDAEGVDIILARTFIDESGLLTALHDRLRRAAGGRIITVQP
jgi:L-threonylcarbamoyladenylate synthase